MIAISFFQAELAFAALWLALRVIVWLRQRRIDWARERQLLLMYLNLAVILRVTFFPAARVNGRVQPLLFDPAAIFPFRLNLEPIVNLHYVVNKYEMLLNITGNVLLFVPSGILFPYLYKALDRFWKVLAAGVGLSLCIEFVQLLFFVRTTDVDDLLFNTLGCVLGYGLYRAFSAK